MHCKIALSIIAAAFVTTASLFAGGLAIELAKPSANPEAQARHAVLVVRAYACSAPEMTSMTATAEGIVNGKRQRLPLKLTRLSGDNTFALTRQWPAEGRWVVTIVTRNPKFNFEPSVMVKVDGDSVDWAGVTRLNGSPNDHEIEAALNTTADPNLPEQK
jgi:hypothetical protein